MWQALHVADLLRQKGAETEIVPMVSSGDVDLRPIDGKRSVGVFTKRIQQALLDGEGDLAVHSMKDLPTERHPSLRMIATPDRETVHDCLVTSEGIDLDSLSDGARIGTGSRRRGAQLLRVRPDLQILPIRGNVQTRLQKLEAGEYDAIVLAAAGLERLEMHALPRVTLSLDIMLPAPGQGALALEVRSGDDSAIDRVRSVNVPATAACTVAERTLLAALHGGCLAPIAALGTIDQAQLQLQARVLSLDGQECLQAADQLPVDLQGDQCEQAAAELGRRVAADLISQGARTLIEAGR
ncbi:hydroxymethylbilane synthase [Roseiconus nitratireducens]|uniref:Hydroxymethylbilane synthase n=2 Tax=Roseiconus nitratireducens TaxID=2605748 RepID=A0A5M6CYJ4_9BACT|nr:hydroxymethylbilane synthase [Roseiconus nitratireducens]